MPPHRYDNLDISHNIHSHIITDSSPPKLSKTNTMSTQNTQNKVIGPTSLSESKCHGAEHSDISHESGFSSEGNLSFYREPSECNDSVPSQSDLKFAKKKNPVFGCSQQVIQDTKLYPRLDPEVLKPLYFEVAQPAPPELSGRDWVFQEIVDALLSDSNPSPGVVVRGNPGTGKTTLVLALVENSCFGTTELKSKGWEFNY